MPHSPTATRTWLLTFRTYATWLPGDARGWNRHATTSSSGSREHGQAHLELYAADHLKTQPVILSDSDRAAVNRAVRDVCACHGWHLLALAVQSNHVHAVIASTEPPPKIATALKAYSTRRLRESGGADRAEVWARGLSQRHLPRDADVVAAVAYVLEGQDVRRE